MGEYADPRTITRVIGGVGTGYPGYYARPYRIYDYRGYRLRHPPHGHHWVRVDRDAVLVAIATGWCWT